MFGKVLPFVSESFQMEAKSIKIFQEINVVKLCKSFYQGNKHYELYICFATLVYPRASRFFFFCEEELHLAFFHRPWWMGYVGISFSISLFAERKNEEETTATKTALGKFLRHCRDLAMKSLTKLLPSGGSRRRRVLSHSQMKWLKFSLVLDISLLNLGVGLVMLESIYNVKEKFHLIHDVGRYRWWSLHEGVLRVTHTWSTVG